MEIVPGTERQRQWQRVSIGPRLFRHGNLVPAGSVYFFEVLSGNAEDLVKNLWLRSVCDEDQDRWDGFGLAIWRLWDYAD
jgi:CRISPR-associated protein Cmr3